MPPERCVRITNTLLFKVLHVLKLQGVFRDTIAPDALPLLTYEVGGNDRTIDSILENERFRLCPSEYRSPHTVASDTMWDNPSLNPYAIDRVEVVHVDGNLAGLSGASSVMCAFHGFEFYERTVIVRLRTTGSLIPFALSFSSDKAKLHNGASYRVQPMESPTSKAYQGVFSLPRGVLSALNVFGPSPSDTGGWNQDKRTLFAMLSGRGRVVLRLFSSDCEDTFFLRQKRILEEGLKEAAEIRAEATIIAARSKAGASAKVRKAVKAMEVATAALGTLPTPDALENVTTDAAARSLARNTERTLRAARTKVAGLLKLLDRVEEKRRRAKERDTQKVR